MAKAKVKKVEIKEKKEISNEMYSKAVLLTGFVASIKNELAKAEKVSAVRFVPILDGYQVFFNNDGKDTKISIEKSKFSKGYKVRKLEDGFKKKALSVKSEEDLEPAIAKLFNKPTEKRKKKEK